MTEVNDKLRALRVRFGNSVPSSVESKKSQLFDALVSILGRSTGSEVEGLKTISKETDHTLDTIEGTAIVVNDGKLATMNDEAVKDPDNTLGTASFQRNYVGSPTRNTNSSWNTSSESVKTSQYGAATTGQSTSEAYNRRVVFPGSPAYYEKALGELSEFGPNVSTEVKKIK